MRKLIISTSTLLAVIAIVAGVTTAFYNDVETSSGNTLSAGAIDLGIDNTSYYNGVLNPGTSWQLTYELDDLLGPAIDIEGDETGEYLFFNFFDLKPGDWGEDTISIHVKDNDAWACMSIDLTKNDDNGLTEPESKVDQTIGLGNGELQNYLQFVWWADDGDNVLETDEAPSAFVSDQPLSEADDLDVILADSTGNGIFQPGSNSDPLAGNTPYYIGKAWCFGELTLNPAPEGNGDPTINDGIDCDGSGLGNNTQTDTVEGDISFTAVQERHSPGFRCGGGNVGCLDEADMMLVIDRSGSISNTELDTLQAAATGFVTAVAPSTAGVHMGQSSFSTTATLDQVLTDSAAAMTAAIANLDSFTRLRTNLSHGIDLAKAELESVRDRDDNTVPDFIVVLTDGAPNEPGGTEAAGKAAATASANAADLAGIKIFVVGINVEATNATYLQTDIASTPADYFNATDFAALSAILTDIASCD